MNNYEISDWQWKYLLLWSKHPEKHFISSKVFLTYVNAENIPALNKYFEPYHNNITISLFIEFICIFSFCDNEMLIYCIFIIFIVFLSMNNNVKYITRDEIFNLIKALNADPVLLIKITEQLHYVNKDEYLIEEFLEVTKNSSYLLSKIYDVKNELINKIIGKENYQNIINRIKYYNSLPDNTDLIEPPESCYRLFMRRLLLQGPSPYYFNYHPEDRLTDFSDIMNSIKSRFKIKSKVSRESSVIRTTANISISVNVTNKTSNENTYSKKNYVPKQFAIKRNKTAPVYYKNDKKSNNKGGKVTI